MSSPYGLYKLGNKRVTMITTKSYAINKTKANLKKLSCSDCRLKLVCMKAESQVIENQHVSVNMYLNLAHTARHMLGANFV